MLSLGLENGDLVHLTSKRGSIVAPAQSSDELGIKQAFMAMHWGDPVSSVDETIKTRHWLASTPSPHQRIALTSKQPELKHAAVKILKAELP
jgi:assimilatory nitrate reductase catalytic subunit